MVSIDANANLTGAGKSYNRRIVLCGVAMSLFSRLLGQITARAPASMRQAPRTYPATAAELQDDRLMQQGWYYGVELLEGLGMKGLFPADLPMLPRQMMRRIDLAGAACLDMGTMEGLMPVLMCRGGASRVLAVDASEHCLEKIDAVRHYHGVDFDFRSVGLMYDLYDKLAGESFDLINCSGLLYHVVSPMHVLLGVRPLLKRNGLMIISTNVVISDRHLMEFNDGGRLQEETNTFWYLSVKYFDYMLRFLKLQPVDFAYYPHSLIRSDVRYVADVNSGYLSVVCRAHDAVLPVAEEAWMGRAIHDSWEMTGLTDWQRAAQQPRSVIRYKKEPDAAFWRADGSGLDLHAAVVAAPDPAPATDPADAHFLHLSHLS